MTVRPTRSEDTPGMINVLDSTGLFPAEMLPGMLAGYLSDKTCDDVWLSCEVSAEVAGFCYAVPEDLTDGTWNMLAIVVFAEKQGLGIGGAIVQGLEAVLREKDQRLIVVDTSGRDEFEQVRDFYRKNGYSEEARIRDFWAIGDDKVVFRKAL